MARGTQLSELVRMLRAETGMSVNPNLGINSEDTYKLRLKRVQERLYHEYDWPFLKGKYDKAMTAGTRYYDCPVEPESIQRVEVKWGNAWAELPYGIGGEQYTSRDSDSGQREDPPHRWQFRIDPTNDSLIDNEQFEVWPIPASNNVSTVRFWGKRKLAALVSNTDKCTLDDQLIVLYAAATLIKDKGDREFKLAEAQALFNRLKGRSSKNKMFVLGGEGGSVSLPRKPGPVRVVLSSS